MKIQLSKKDLSNWTRLNPSSPNAHWRPRSRPCKLTSSKLREKCDSYATLAVGPRKTWPTCSGSRCPQYNATNRAEGACLYLPGGSWSYCSTLIEFVKSIYLSHGKSRRINNLIPVIYPPASSLNQRWDMKCMTSVHFYGFFVGVDGIDGVVMHPVKKRHPNMP